jgi:aspartyl-tRNA(Asn)/glutamyl-tRNA(Gln) amidotransferase subunit B
LPELPAGKRARYEKDYGIKGEDVEVFVGNPIYSALFETTVALVGRDKAQLVANYITSDLAGLHKNGVVGSPTAEAFAELVAMITAGEVSSRGAKDILAVLTAEGGTPRAIAEEKGLFQKSDEGELLQMIELVIVDNAKVVADYKAGNEKSLQFLVGQGMKLSKGSANPGVLAKLLVEKMK